jgi:putative hydrolase of the HAD superfamily
VPATHAIVFDLDDTLYPERRFTFSGYRAVAGAFADRLGKPPDLLIARMQELFGTPDRGRVFNVILAEAGVADAESLVPAMVAAFRAHQPAISLYPDADAALDGLRGRCRLGLISDGPLQMQRNKLAALGLPSRLDEIILTDEWGPDFWKPHPRAFEEMSLRLGLSPGDCTYVADNPAKDFIAPYDLGWQTVRVRRPEGVYRDQPAPPGGGPGVTIDTLEALSLR